MITATHEQIREILKTLPIGYYLGERTPVIYEESGDSYCNLMDRTIHVSGETVMHGLAHLPADLDPYETENAVRAILYHELSHVIMTPKMKVYKWLNCFEDERIETLLSKYYLGVNFKKMCMAVNGWTKDWMPEDADGYWYGICRFRQGPEKFVKKVAELIRKWKTLRAGASDYRTEDYRDDVKRFYEQVCADWNQNKQQRQQEQEERNDERNQEQDKRDQQKQGQQGNQQGQSGEGQDGEGKNDKSKSGNENSQDKGGKNAQGGQAGKDKSNGKDKQDESAGSGDKNKDKPEQGEGAGDGEDGQEDEGDQNDQSNGQDGGEGTEGDEDADADDQNGQQGHGKSSKNRGKDATDQQRGNGDQGSPVNESNDQESEDDSSKGAGAEGDDAEEDEDVAEEEINGRVGADNEEEINEITRESIARDFLKLLNKFHEEQVGRTLERLIIQHNKKRASRTPMSLGYTGKVDYKKVATQHDYRWFARKGGAGENKFGSTHLTLWVDCSGSFCEDIHRINSVIHELNRLARRLGRDFSFDVVQMTMKNEVVPSTVQLRAEGCNGFGPGVEECIRKTRKAGCNNYNVVVWDGDMFSGFYSSTQNRWLPILGKAFNNQNTVIVSDGENKGYLDRQCPKARTRIIHGRYAEQFVEALLQLLSQVLV